MFGDDGSDNHRREVVRTDPEPGMSQLNSLQTSTVEFAGSEPVVSVFDCGADAFWQSRSGTALADHVRAQVRVPEQDGRHELRAEAREMDFVQLKTADVG